MFHAKLAVPVAPVPSLTVTVTVLLPDAVGVPEISPLEALIASPAGRPVAEEDRGWPVAESDAWIWRRAAVPTVPVCAPGLVTVTASVPLPPPPAAARAFCTAV